jgi:hypothetical protein
MFKIVVDEKVRFITFWFWWQAFSISFQVPNWKGFQFGITDHSLDICVYKLIVDIHFWRHYSLLEFSYYVSYTKGAANQDDPGRWALAVS